MSTLSIPSAEKNFSSYSPKNRYEETEDKEKNSSEEVVLQTLQDTEAEIIKLSSWKKSVPQWQNLQKQYIKAIMETDVYEYQTKFSTALESVKNSELKATTKMLEKKEKKILTMGWQESISPWEKLSAEYKEVIKNSGSPLHIKEHEKNLSRIESSVHKASLYASFSKTKKEECWKKSVNIYSALLKKAQSSKVLSTLDKKELIQDFSQALQLAEHNTLLKESHADLLTDEAKAMKMGYRDSKIQWKILTEKYEKLARGSDTPKYQKIFSNKEREMQQNFTVADLHGQMEDIKENNSSWDTVLAEYGSTLKKVISANIPHEEKKFLFHELEQCQEICIANMSAKKKVEEAIKKIEKAVSTEPWEVSLNTHKEIFSSLSSISDKEKKLLTSKRKQKLEMIQIEAYTNIQICITNITENENNNNETFSMESIAQEDPHVAYLVMMAMMACKNNKVSATAEEKNSEPGIRDLSEEETQLLQHETQGQDTPVCNISQADDALSQQAKSTQAKKLQHENSQIFMYCEKENQLLTRPESIAEKLFKAIIDHKRKKGEKISSKECKEYTYRMLVEKKIENHHISKYVEYVG